jgi:hypothetical protein
VFHKARGAAFTEQEAASLAARRPYDLRHAAVSTWLNAGVAPPQVAEWAGHSVDVLLRVYARLRAALEPREGQSLQLSSVTYCAHTARSSPAPPKLDRATEVTWSRLGQLAEPGVMRCSDRSAPVPH